MNICLQAIHRYRLTSYCVFYIVLIGKNWIVAPSWKACWLLIIPERYVCAGMWQFAPERQPGQLQWNVNIFRCLSILAWRNKDLFREWNLMSEWSQNQMINQRSTRSSNDQNIPKRKHQRNEWVLSTSLQRNLFRSLLTLSDANFALKSYCSCHKRFSFVNINLSSPA